MVLYTFTFITSSCLLNCIQKDEMADRKAGSLLGAAAGRILFGSLTATVACLLVCFVLLQMCPGIFFRFQHRNRSKQGPQRRLCHYPLINVSSTFSFPFSPHNKFLCLLKVGYLISKQTDKFARKKPDIK